jgi:hypothetical protein
VQQLKAVLNLIIVLTLGLILSPVVLAGLVFLLITFTGMWAYAKLFVR